MTKIASAAAGFGVSSAAGPLVMLLGMLLFARNDAMGKWLVSS